MYPNFKPSRTFDFDPKAITAQRGGDWNGTYGMIACVICQPEGRPDQKALKIEKDNTNGRLLVHCFKSQCSFLDVCAKLGGAEYYYRGNGPAHRSVFRSSAKVHGQKNDNSQAAHRIWGETTIRRGTPCENYLSVVRGLGNVESEALRFHPRCFNAPTKAYHPAMIAKVDGVGGFAIHRTYLTPSGRKITGACSKMALGPTATGAVRLTEASNTILVAEGIETALAAGILCDEAVSVWAALFASNVKGLCLPVKPSRLIIAIDPDDTGRAAASALAQRALHLGWDVATMDPKGSGDWADILVDQVHARECAQ